jgi:glycosyltransferase involved in cell wall biosynthesis
MRIVQISTSDMQGGAGRAAYRLFQGLRALGHDCSMLVKQKSSGEKHIYQAELEDNGASKQWEREIKWVEKYYIKGRRTAVSNSYFSLPAPGYDLSAHEQILHADVLNLHWVSGLLSPPAIARLQQLGKPIIWTLHDQRAFTGGCHYSAGCNLFENTCRVCPQLAPDDLAWTEAALQESLQQIGSGLTIVSPSRWLAECARRSALLRQRRIEVIPNGLDIEVFRPHRAEARQQLGLDPHRIYLLFGTDNFSESRKGFALLCEAVGRCMDNTEFREAVLQKEINFLFFGNAGPIQQLNFPAQWLGRLDSEQVLARVYAACDGFLLPSTEDNLPNTMIESMCCATPVIGFEIGGLPDAIISNETGLLVPRGDVASLAEAIQNFTSHRELRHRLSEQCALQIPPRYSLRSQAERYLALYQDELTAPQPVVSSKSAARGGQPSVPLGSFAQVFPALVKRAKKERRAHRWNSILNFFKTK